MPKLTKREMERAAAAAAAAAPAALEPLPAGAGALLPLLPDGAVAYDPLISDAHAAAAAMYNNGGGGGGGAGGQKRRAEDAFGQESQGSGEDDAHSKVSSTSKSTATAYSAGGGGGAATARARKTPQRQQQHLGDAETPGGGGATPLSLGNGFGEKSLKGLRHFSLKVCKKVEEKGRTNYNEVADELVAEVLSPQIDPLTGEVQPPDCQYDEKNIRRRVYDALNVLMAMDIISKEKKEIRWKGLPSQAQPDLGVLQRDKRRLEQSLQRKKEHLQELLMQRVAFQRLVRRNAGREQQAQQQAQAAAAAAGGGGGGGAGRGAGQAAAAAAAEEAAAALREDEEARKIPLPFIIINTSSQTVIQCEMTEDRSDVFFNFSAPFEINDDNEVLKRMALQRNASPEEVQAYVPPELLKYVPPDAMHMPHHHLPLPPMPMHGGTEAAAAAAAAAVGVGGLDAALHDGGYGPL